MRESPCFGPHRQSLTVGHLLDTAFELWLPALGNLVRMQIGCRFESKRSDPDGLPPNSSLHTADIQDTLTGVSVHQ